MTWSDNDGDDVDDYDHDKNNFYSSYCLSDYHTVYIGMCSSFSDEHAATFFREKLLSSFLILFILFAVHVVVCVHPHMHIAKLCYP
jgi:hypothetical protein